jgi:hypothetical protein
VGKSNYHAFFVLLTCTLTLLLLEVSLGVATAVQCFQGKWASATRLEEVYGGGVTKAGLEAAVVTLLYGLYLVFMLVPGHSAMECSASCSLEPDNEGKTWKVVSGRLAEKGLQWASATVARELLDECRVIEFESGSGESKLPNRC